jgi:uncharacterized protein (TIGR00730 family)
MRKHLGIFCGSHIGKDPCYQVTTKSVAELLVANNIELVYGGGRLGLMGLLADTMLELGGVVIGVETQFLLAREGHSGLTKLHTVETMHERKALMSQLSDAFLLLPGGAGSLDEFFEVYTWGQLKLHSKPCAILNADHYYDFLIQFIDHAVEKEFIESEDRNTLQILNNIPSVLDLLK